MIKLATFLGVVIILVTLVFGFIFFEPFFSETEETIVVINKEVWKGEGERYFIFTENEVFLNENNYYHNKNNADDLYPQFQVGKTYRVKIVGYYLPQIPRFRNIINIIDQKETNVALPNK
jgi:hypothetical protein